MTYSFRQSFSLYGMQVMLFENQCKWHRAFSFIHFLQRVSWRCLHHGVWFSTVTHPAEMGSQTDGLWHCLYSPDFRQIRPMCFSLVLINGPCVKFSLSLCLPLPQITQMESDSHQQYQVRTSKSSSTSTRPTPRTARSSQMTYGSPLPRSRKWRNTE